jgi:hypothetical protein
LTGRAKILNLACMHIQPHRTPKARALLLCTLPLLLAGCLQPGGLFARPKGLAPTMDRMVAAYDDLASRRFQVFTDFEDPAQGTLFRMEPADTPGAVGVSTDVAQPQTGVGSLKVSFTRADQHLVCAAAPDSEWGFPRDWSKYHLLLLSVNSPRPLGGFIISARSGTNVEMHYENPPLLLKTGWNLIRLDLGDMAEQIDLADVRALDFRCEPLDAPADLYLDDLILVDNARDIFATPEQQPGDLFVRTAGRRLAVGAVDRFELVLSRGRIRQWYDLNFDKSRIRNLVGVGSLGPDPAPVIDGQTLAGDAAAPAHWLGAGTTLETYQSLVSANPMRVMVQGEWRFTPPNAVPSAADPYHRWVYSIYRDGRIYVECSGVTPGDKTDRQVSLSFCCDGSAGFQRQIASSTQPAGPRKGTATGDDYLLFSRPGKGQADLLIVPFKSPASCTLRDSPDSRSCGDWLFNIEGGTFSFAAMVRVSPPDIDSRDQAAPMAADYRHPLPMQFDAGQLVRTDPGDFDNDGFAESRGYYVLQLDGNTAKIRIDGQQVLRFSPVFKIVDVTRRDVWAYLDGRQIKETIRDEDGNLLLLVPGIVSREVLLEITSRPRDANTK